MDRLYINYRIPLSLSSFQVKFDTNINGNKQPVMFSQESKDLHLKTEVKEEVREPLCDLLINKMEKATEFQY